MVPSKVKVAFAGANRLYTYFNDEFDLRSGDVVYVEGKMWKRPGQVREVCPADPAEKDAFNKVLQGVNLKVHGTYYSYGPYMFSFEGEAIDFAQFRSWVSPPLEEDVAREQTSFDLKLDELGSYDWIPESALSGGMRHFKEESVQYLAVIDGKGFALVKEGQWHSITFDYDGRRMYNMVCRRDHGFFSACDAAVCLTLRALLDLFDKEFFDQFDGRNFTAVNRQVFYQIIAYSLEKISL